LLISLRKYNVKTAPIAPTQLAKSRLNKPALPYKPLKTEVFSGFFYNIALGKKRQVKT
jgi:hypothetical protein